MATLYSWATPADWFVREYRYGVYDSDMADMDLPRIHELADMVHREWKSGQRTLVRCQAGWNRSGLITALVLMKDGYSAGEAISLIRARRSKWALCNDKFEQYLYGLDKAQ